MTSSDWMTHPGPWLTHTDDIQIGRTKPVNTENVFPTPNCSVSLSLTSSGQICQLTQSLISVLISHWLLAEQGDCQRRLQLCLQTMQCTASDCTPAMQICPQTGATHLTFSFVSTLAPTHFFWVRAPDIFVFTQHLFTRYALCRNAGHVSARLWVDSCHPLWLWNVHTPLVYNYILTSAPTVPQLSNGSLITCVCKQTRFP